MKKRALFALLICVLALCLVISCKDSGGGGGGGGGGDVKRPAELKLNYLRPYYLKGSEESELDGSLIYTDTDGKITSVNLKEGIAAKTVTTDFDSKAVKKDAILKITYQGIDCTGTYSIVDIDDVSLGGCYVVAMNTTYDFYDVSKVLVATYTGWGDFMDYSSGTMVDKTYSLGISGTTGKTIVKVEGDTTTYYPDGKGGLEGYFSDVDLPEPEIERWYVSLNKETGNRVNLHAKDHYLAVRFTLDGAMKMWFCTEDQIMTAGVLDGVKLEDIKDADSPDVIIPASQVGFDNHGVRVFKATVAGKADWASNMSVYSRSGDFNDSFTVVSYDGDSYNGYSYSMKLGPEDP